MQQWTIEEISIFSNSSHLEWRAVQCIPRCFYFYRTFVLVIEKFLPDQTNFYQTEKKKRYLQNVNNFVLVVFDQLIPVILSADKKMKRQRMILFPRASSKTFNQIFISVYMYFDYWSLAYLCFFFLQVPSPFFFLLKYYCDLIPHKWF
jgi:hypothetical protein